MAQSPQFRKLERRLKQLRRHLLPKSFSPTGSYSARQLDMASAYRLLCHAEIEHFIEDAAKAVVLCKVNAAKLGKVSLTALTLVAYHKVGWDGLLVDENDNAIPQTDKPNPFKHPLSKLLTDAAQEYFGRIVSNNHGIKTENLQRLLKPTGVDFDSLDQAWLTEMDEFGKQRGLTAHTSAVGVTRSIDPKDEYDRVEILRNGLETLDQALNKLLNSKN